LLNFPGPPKVRGINIRPTLLALADEVSERRMTAATKLLKVLLAEAMSDAAAGSDRSNPGRLSPRKFRLHAL
jgi:hypothetical protein